jgi:hypothetical protein
MSDVIVNEFKGYSLFSEIENKMLRAYNQWNVISNLTQNGYQELAYEYLNTLPQEDKVGLTIITTYIKMKGLEETKREIIAEGFAA